MKRGAILLVLMIFSTAVYAQETFSVDMPANLGYLEEFTITLHVGDKDLREKANYLAYSDYCGIAWKDKMIPLDSLQDNLNPNYNHEETLEVKGVVPSPNRQGKNCSITFKLYKTELLGPEIPKDFKGISYATWKDNKPTYWRHDELATLKKEVRIHPTEIVVNLPSGYNFRSENTFPFTGSAFSIHEQPACYTNECFLQYSVYYGIRPKGYYGPEDYKGTKKIRQIFDEDMDKRGTTWQVPTETVDDYVLKALGAKEGYYRKLVEVQKFATFDPVSLHIEFLIDKGDYYIYYYSIWDKNAPKDKGQEYIDAQVDVEKKTLSSIMFRPHKDDLLVAKEPEKPTEKSIKIEGTVRDTDNKTMPYIEVNILAQKNNITTYTDKDGKYSATLTKIKFAPGKNETDANITVTLSYKRDGKNYFAVVWGAPPIFLTKRFKLNNVSESIRQDMLLNGHNSADESTNVPRLSDLYHFSVMYTHTAEITNFALTELGANIDYKLPVEVNPSTSRGTFYSIADSHIEINLTDSGYASTDKPDNREYHEFCHHITFAEWNGQTNYNPGDRNHDGYINGNTADSYVEGFAEFCSMACSKYMGDPKPEVYAQGFGSMEFNYKAWSYQGKYEEFAFSGVLWDLYDTSNDRGDTVSLPLKDLYAVLKVKRKDINEYYKALKAAFPQSADGIDRIFISHGFFKDLHEGNKTRDREEPYKDTNNNGRYDAGEPFVDYGQIEGLVRPWMQYEDGYLVGPATNYERGNRSQAVRLEDAYVKAADAGVKEYMITVQPKNPEDGAAIEYETYAVNGLIYVAPLPEDLDADIIIKTDSKEYASTKEYRITNKEYVNKYYSKPEGQKYVDSYNFEAKPTAVKEENIYAPSMQQTAARQGGGEIRQETAEHTVSQTGNTQPNTGTGETSAGISSNTVLGVAGIALVGGGLLIFGAIILVVIFLVLKKKK